MDTAHRIELFVRGTQSSGPYWRVRSSPYPAEVHTDDHGRFQITAHPARPSDGRPTVLELNGIPAGTLRVSGSLSFYDARCRGSRLQAGVSEGGGWSSLGVFTPRAAEAPFAATITRPGGGPLLIEVQPAPDDPNDIDYCTVLLKDLEVSPVP
jgi:hypothetical protein